MLRRSSGRRWPLLTTAVLVLALLVWCAVFRDATEYAGLCARPDWPPPATSGVLPRTVVQTHVSLAAIPAYVNEQYERLASGLTRRVYSDADAAEYVAAHYRARVARAYERLRGAHRADLFRYCYLYREGGVYLDIKTVLHVPLGAILDHVEAQGCNLALSLSQPRLMFPFDEQVFQGIIFARPGVPLLLECIEYIARYWWRTRLEYFALLRNMTNRLRVRHGPLEPGLTRDGQVYFFTETLSFLGCAGEEGRVSPLLQRSRKTHNCSVVRSPSGDILFGTRFPDFPWKHS